MSVTSAYVMGRSAEETKRLQVQSKLFEPALRRLFREAGLSPGMKVLDVGSGAGDVALLAAELVGPSGRVVGVDSNATILETARARAREANFDHVSFVAGDVRSMPRNIILDTPFDAVVGRAILVYLPEPAALVRALSEHVRPGGVFAFQDIDWSIGPVALPASRLLERVYGWAIPTFTRAGLETQMGLKMFRAFVDAGLPAPQMHVDGPAGGGPDWVGYEYMSSGLRSMLPLMEKFGVTTADEMAIDTFADRFREETVRQGGVVMVPPFVSAWTRKA